jgi:hypothetical protein
VRRLDFAGSGLVSNASDTTDHTVGNHGWHNAPTGDCGYPGPPEGQCISNVSAQSGVGLTKSETGSITPNTCHVPALGYVDGSATGAPATANTNAGVVTTTCNVPCSCTALVSFSGNNAVFATTGTQIWNHTNPYSITCPTRSSTMGARSLDLQIERPTTSRQKARATLKIAWCRTRRSNMVSTTPTSKGIGEIRWGEAFNLPAARKHWTFELSPQFSPILLFRVFRVLPLECCRAGWRSPQFSFPDPYFGARKRRYKAHQEPA